VACRNTLARQPYDFTRITLIGRPISTVTGQKRIGIKNFRVQTIGLQH
jgi:hypothetical protein